MSSEALVDPRGAWRVNRGTGRGRGSLFGWWIRHYLPMVLAPEDRIAQTTGGDNDSSEEGGSPDAIRARPDRSGVPRRRRANEWGGELWRRRGRPT